MINTLNGLFYPTAGTALIYDYDIMYDIDALRQVMGVCPQVRKTLENTLTENNSMTYCGEN